MYFVKLCILGVNNIIEFNKIGQEVFDTMSPSIDYFGTSPLLSSRWLDKKVWSTTKSEIQYSLDINK